jgi:hypothetical protein
MSQPVVLITFSCQTGDTERLALSAAVGAIQGRALIRLRRLPDSEAAGNTETLLRMRKEYVPPTEGDILGADVVILVSHSDTIPSAAPWADFLSLLRKLRADGKLLNKLGAATGGIALSVADLEFMKPEDMMDSVALGRTLAERARALKSA